MGRSNEIKTNPEERYFEHKKILSEDPGDVEAFRGLVEYCVKKSILSVDPKISEAYINEADAAIYPFLGNVKKEEDEKWYWNANRMIGNAKRVYHLREDSANKLKYALLVESHGENILIHYIEQKDLLRKRPRNVKIFREYVDYSLALASHATNMDQRWTYILNVNDAEDIFLEGRRESEEARKITEEARRRMNMAKQAAIKEERKQSYAEYMGFLTKKRDEAKSILDKDPGDMEALRQYIDSCIRLRSGKTNPDEKWIHVVEAHEMWRACLKVAVERGNYGIEIADIFDQLEEIIENDMFS